MLGFEALGVFALGQGEPWTLKGKLQRVKSTGRGKQPQYGEKDLAEPIAAKAPRSRKTIKTELPKPTLDPSFIALVTSHEDRLTAIKQDDEEAVIALLVAA